MKTLGFWRAATALGVWAQLLTRALPAGATEAESPHVYAPLPGSDGVYGRFDGRLDWGFAAGAEIAAAHPRGSLRLSAHYLATAGIYARYADAFAKHQDFSTRLISFGVDLKPLFLPRFARDYERGPATLDLLVDSVSLSAGAYFAERRKGDSGSERGFEAGLGFGVPLCGRARGLWLEARGERRFADRGPNDWVVTAALAFHVITWTTEPSPP